MRTGGHQVKKHLEPMPTPNQLILQGCAPTPLASYLKALGVLRLLSSAANNVEGTPADLRVRGWWKNERFHLLTLLGRDELLRFFLYHYAPSPAIAPWNGGSGFYPKDNKEGFGPLSSPNVAERFRPFSKAIRCAVEIVNMLGLEDRPQGPNKARLVALLRARVPEPALRWIDAAIVMSGDNLRFPPLLGTGGNDGRLDFTNTFMRRLVGGKRKNLFDASSGAPTLHCREQLENSLFRLPIRTMFDSPAGQFSPGAGGPNATIGYKSKPLINPWDYVLMLEGASMFASAATRRHESSILSRASFPFTVKASGAGDGGVDASDEADSRAEFWAPLWNRSASFREVDALFNEGRAVSNGQTSVDGLSFAHAIASLGVSRGISEFQRYGFLQRAGKAYYAAALGRRSAEASPGAGLYSDLNSRGWLKTVQRYSRGQNQPAALRSATKALEDSLFDVLRPNSSYRTVAATLEAIGQLAMWLSKSPVGQKEVPPPPLLSGTWMDLANDGSPEFGIAAALAGLGLDLPDVPGNQSQCVPPMAAHLAPLTDSLRDGFERMTFFTGNKLRRNRSWSSDPSPPTVVWVSGELVQNMIAILERRFVETSIRGLAEKPLGSARFARLPDIAAFLKGDFDDRRCSALLAGLVWAKPSWTSAGGSAQDSPRPILPFAYAALKPVFSTDTALLSLKAIPSYGSVPVPPGLVGLLRAGGRCRDGQVIDRAVRIALWRAHSSGLCSPFFRSQFYGGAHALDSGRIGVGIRPDRMAAAMLIPISRLGLASILRRAYPGTIYSEETHHTGEI